MAIQKCVIDQSTGLPREFMPSGARNDKDLDRLSLANAERNVGDASKRPGCMHPNDVDRKRIEKALAARARYRYVEPEVRAEEGGYRIESPCCSRNVDQSGGVIDIARLEYVAELQTWHLFRKDHAQRTWQFYGAFDTLSALLHFLNQDPDRIFWQ